MAAVGAGWGGGGEGGVAEGRENDDGGVAVRDKDDIKGDDDDDEADINVRRVRDSTESESLRTVSNCGTAMGWV